MNLIYYKKSVNVKSEKTKAKIDFKILNFMHTEFKLRDVGTQ